MTGVVRWIRRVAIALAAITAVGIAAAVLWPTVPPPPAAAERVSRTRPLPRTTEAALDSAIDIIHRAAPLQPSRTPTPPRRAADTLPAQPAPPRPVLVLTALAGGASPAAVVEGIPGVEGARVLRVSDTVSGLRLVAIRNGIAIISGLDTTWHLQLREP